jgi:hypothetical protein
MGASKNVPATLDLGQFPVLTLGASELQEIVTANIGTGGANVFDLDRVKIPAGGGTMWSIPSIEGGDENRDELTGIVVGFRDGRLYWMDSFDDTGGGTPPDCSSQDGLVGIGKRYENEEPGRWECATCPMAQFGSAKDGSGAGQACRQIRLIFMVQPGTMLPVVLAMPPTSLKPCRQYMLRLVSHGVPYYGVVTGVGLEKTKSGGGIAYSQATFRVVQKLGAGEVEKIRAYVKSIEPLITQRPLRADDYMQGAPGKAVGAADGTPTQTGGAGTPEGRSAKSRGKGTQKRA